MTYRIEITNKDLRAEALNTRTGDDNIKCQGIIDVYTVDKYLSEEQIDRLAKSLCNEVTGRYIIKGIADPSPKNLADFPTLLQGEGDSYFVEIGYLPGVTDNIGNTAKQIAEDLLNIKFSDEEGVYSSQMYLFLSNHSPLEGESKRTSDSEVRLGGGGTVSEQNADPSPKFIEQISTLPQGEGDLESFAEKHLYNKLIQRIHIKSQEQFEKDGGMDIIVPKVHLHENTEVTEVDLNISDEELLEIGTKGIKDRDGTFRGPLGLSLLYMKAIQEYFAKEGRNPTDIELETLAQTWSEHCKHTIFASPIDDVQDGLYKHYIKRATNDIRKAKGEDDFCVSVFTDNAGGIIFDDDWVITDKVETHNSPSALDPFGGSITGIVGVNRDTIGFGKGAKPIINRYGFCFADPSSNPEIYRGKNKQNPILSPKQIMDGVIEGVNKGGNHSGIPTPQGFVYFDPRYAGKPLVFVGTVGLIPREINGKPSHEKEAKKGDKIVMVGGRVGKDGIHGATFSSVALDEGSPSTAVQIGDPITQKKFSDAIIKEARDKELYNAITDNGAGGLSSSVGEMGEAGFVIDIDKVPLKYAGMSAWEIWISESQERMTLAIPDEKIDEFIALMNKRGVEATVVGEFTGDGRAVIRQNGKVIMDMDTEFLHDGLPEKHLKTSQFYHSPLEGESEVANTCVQQTPVGGNKEEKFCQQLAVSSQLNDPSPKFAEQISTLPQGEGDNLSDKLLNKISDLNICSKEFIATQYDHEVQASSVLKPLQGKGRVYGDATVSRPVLSSQKGVVTSQGITAKYSDIDTYHMAACAIDTAVRNAVAVGGNIDHLALLDNFCWCSSDEPERLYQLKKACEACYDYALAYGTPFISGKDSMFNDFNGFDKDNNPIKISVPPTLLVSSLGVIDDVTKAVSLDPKFAGDLVFVIGETFNEMGDIVPKVNALKAKEIYRKFYQAVNERLISSSISVGLGGLGTALAKKAIGGQLGLSVDLSEVGNELSDEAKLFSETQSRFIVTIAPQNKEKFEEIMSGVFFREIGRVTEDKILSIDGIAKVGIKELEEKYKCVI